MRIIGAIVLVVMMATSGYAATRYASGVGFPTTETLGGESITGTLDWGSPSDITSLDYDLTWGTTNWVGMFNLLTTNIAGSSAQLVYGDATNDLILTAISADGSFNLDADLFVDTGGYGGFEAWTLTDANPALNRYGTITHISSVPEPGLQIAAVCGGLCLLVFRRRFLRWTKRHDLARA